MGVLVWWDVFILFFFCFFYRIIFCIIWLNLIWFIWFGLVWFGVGKVRRVGVFLWVFVVVLIEWVWLWCCYCGVRLLYGWVGRCILVFDYIIFLWRFWLFFWGLVYFNCCVRDFYFYLRVCLVGWLSELVCNGVFVCSSSSISCGVFWLWFWMIFDFLFFCFCVLWGY